MDIKLKRVYEQASSDDGMRILVDRLWPQGESKVKADLDEWMKDIAPSTELREWFHDHLDDWSEFERRYNAELDDNPDQVNTMVGYLKKGRVTFVYASKDTEHNNAVVLKAYMENYTDAT